MMQAEIVCSNICAIIAGKKLNEYKPMALEGALRLGLGKEDILMYIHNDDGSEMLVLMKNENVDLDVKQMWWNLGMEFEE